VSGCQISTGSPARHPDCFAIRPLRFGERRIKLSSFWLAIVLAFAAFAAWVLPARALDFPTLTGRVVDEANIISTSARAALTSKLEALEAKTTDQVVVVTLKSLQGTSIEDFGVQLGRRWQIGQRGKNNGVLLIVAPSERRVRIEIGRGLEGTLTDAISRLIIETSITPRFRAGDFAGGISRGVDDIIQVLTGDAEEWKQRAARQPRTNDGWQVGLGFFVMLLAFGLVMLLVRRDLARLAQKPGRHGSIAWAPTSSDSSWSSGSGGGSSDSGGFSGGGGDFGGGGASGSW
jgi:uncharacterized protein